MDICKNITLLRDAVCTSTKLDDEIKGIVIESLDELVDCMADYYCVIFDSNSMRITSKRESFNIKDYQDKVKTFDTKRKNMHNNIINIIAMLDRISKSNSLPFVYGRLTDEELNNTKLVKDDLTRRTEVADDIIRSIAQMVS